MKKIGLSGLVILFALFSCKKEDFQETQNTAASTAVTTTRAAWKTVDNWTASGSSYQASITDSSLTTSIVNEGLVLLYAKGDSTQVLPAKVANVNYYYQAAANTIQITAGAEVKTKPLFTYVLFTKEQLAALEQQGVSLAQLMKMNYEKVLTLKK